MWRWPAEGIRSPRIGAIGSCVLPDVGAGNCKQVPLPHTHTLVKPALKSWAISPAPVYYLNTHVSLQREGVLNKFCPLFYVMANHFWLTCFSSKLTPFLVFGSAISWWGWRLASVSVLPLTRVSWLEAKVLGVTHISMPTAHTFQLVFIPRGQFPVI